jgi:HK97 family phage portal protein
VGILAETFGLLGGLLPERKSAIGATINTWEAGIPQQSKESFYRYAMDAYSGNEVAYACIEERCTSAAEPRLVAVRKSAKGEPEQIKDHPVLELFEANPFIDSYTLLASWIMYHDIGGNGFIEKVRSGAGKVVELWPLRPDRMWVIPDANPNIHLRGWEYKLGADTTFLSSRDVIHWKSRNPLDDWYGLPLFRPAAMRIDSANAMRAFTHAFFRNAGVPAGLLTFEKQVGQAEAQMVRDRFRNDYGGGNAHGVMVLGGVGGGNNVTYTAMGLPLGERGLVMPELDEIIDAKTAMVSGVPLELIGARLGMIHGNRSTTKEARASFWDETLAPLYREMAAVLTLGLKDEYGDFDYLEFDLSTVKALQEDESAKVTRSVQKLHAGIASVQEVRAELGYEAGYDPGAILVMPDNLSGLPADQLDAPPAPAPLAAPGGANTNGSSNGHANGALTPREKEVLGV